MSAWVFDPQTEAYTFIFPGKSLPIVAVVETFWLHAGLKQVIPWFPVAHKEMPYVLKLFV